MMSLFFERPDYNGVFLFTLQCRAKSMYFDLNAPSRRQHPHRCRKHLSGDSNNGVKGTGRCRLVRMTSSCPLAVIELRVTKKHVRAIYTRCSHNS
jgi:hypothetical protein